jgi:hypothetical protein
MELPGTGKSGFKQALISHPCRSAVESEKSGVEREGVALVHPQRLAHLESACSVLR